jgi:DNA-binding response OmpR family regulator
MCKVLVIDDDPDILNIIEIILKQDGFAVDTLTNTNGLMEKISSNKPDIILLDINLEGKNGKEICDEIKREWKHDIKLLLVSGDSNLHHSALDCLADGYLEKPFNIVDVVKTVRNHCK